VHEHLVDQVDFLVGILLGTDQIKVGQLAQHGGAAHIRALRDRTVEFANDFERSAHEPK
jgi:hypothetical protein